MRALVISSLLVLSACPPAPCESSACDGGATDAGAARDAGTDAGVMVDAGSPWEQYCAGHRRAYCGALQRCGHFDSQAVCEASLTAFDCGAVPPGIADGRTGFDATAAAACVTRLGNIACAELDFVTCDGVLTGLGQQDAPCFGSDGECSGGLYCDGSMTCPGRCRPSAAVGATPTSGQPCVAGAYVYDGVCITPVAVGSSCAATGSETAEKECVRGAWCEASSKQCVAQRGEGEACTSYFECRGALRCTRGVCGGLVSEQGACDDSALCKSDLRCGDAGVCVTRVGQGSPCTIETDECTLQFFCDAATSTCQPYRGVDEACTPIGGECGLASGRYCTATFDSDGGVCATLKTPGEPCAAPFECSTGLCDNGQCVGCVDSTP